MKKEIFKAYDIRGIYGDEINEDMAYKIGRAFVLFLNEDKPRVVVARDGRKSSPSLSAAFIKGVIDAKATVLDIGVAPTPLLNFAVINYDCNGGAVITASHNEAQFNGIKLIKEKALQVHGDEIKRIKKIAEEVRESYENEKLDVQKINPLEDYLNHITPLIGKMRNLKVVVDCGNGTGGITARPFFSRFPVETVFMYEEVDGSFPNHPADPHNLQNIASLQKRVLKENADLGIFFDGDADRSILVDEVGEIVSPDILLALFAEEQLSLFPREKVYYDLRFSRVIEEVITKNKGEPVMMRVGNPFYKEKIILENGLLGGELSGHIMFRENFGIDDGLFAAAKAMNTLSKEKKTLSQVLAPYKKYYQSEEISLRVRNKDIAIDRVKSFFSDGEELDIDGLYVRYPKWWFNLRKSNTEDVVRLRIEAENKELLEDKRMRIISVLTK